MKAYPIAFLLFWITIISSPVFSEARCGTMQAAMSQTRTVQQEPLARSVFGIYCTADDLYDTVYSKKTEHLQIFYTLSGPHKTTLPFVESVAKNLEVAWKHHTQTMGMKEPKGVPVSHHYKQAVSDNLYPVEIIDLDNMRNVQNEINGACHGCYGVVVSDQKNTEQSQLYFENDFLYTPYNAVMDTITKNGIKCTYPRADKEIVNFVHNYSYANEWEKGIKVTAFHELYHAVQVRYLNMHDYLNFWFEASATGIEEIAAPEIDDYQSYIKKINDKVGIPFDAMDNPYGLGIFHVYLYNYVDHRSDKYIWEGFSKNPDQNFQYQFNSFMDSKSKSADSVFHDFSTKLSFAGNRSHFVSPSNLICSDESNWPNFTHAPKKINGTNEEFKPNLSTMSYMFYSGGTPNLDNFVGKGAIISYHGDSASIQNFYTANEAHQLFAKAEASSQTDSIVWVFSNFTGESDLPSYVNDPNLRAYPTPWRGGNLCFTPLPRNKDFIEIRNRRGNLVSREKYSGSTFCIEESRVKQLMAPGLYHYRVGSSGKNKDLLIIY